ncbi:MAG TPA: Hsp20/alpha crystallin family protein [Candidatus Altiarchaeales archaeon]|nr:Hsp20/alpha crystallin family protein [Candidatus Altiarchaeales archaeon]
MRPWRRRDRIFDFFRDFEEELEEIRDDLIRITEYNELRAIDEIEPLVDVIERDREVMVVAELPGIKTEDISIYISEDILRIDVDTTARRYHRKLKLPCRVRSDTGTATYKNGVLEVKLERREKDGSGKQGKTE